MTFPEDLRYTKNHEWLRVGDDGGVATIGITDFAQSELGDVVFVELEPVGSSLAADSVFGTVEAVKTVSELYAPVSGTLAEINGDLESKPELVNSDPYDGGWMVKIEMSDPAEVEALMSAEQYQAMVAV